MEGPIEDPRMYELAKEEHERLSNRERELMHYRKMMEHQERELDAYRTRLKEEQFLREKQLQKEIEAREKTF